VENFARKNTTMETVENYPSFPLDIHRFSTGLFAYNCFINNDLKKFSTFPHPLLLLLLYIYNIIIDKRRNGGKNHRWDITVMALLHGENGLSKY
jgi:hypothetical protein